MILSYSYRSSSCSFSYMFIYLFANSIIALSSSRVVENQLFMVGGKLQAHQNTQASTKSALPTSLHASSHCQGTFSLDYSIMERPSITPYIVYKRTCMSAAFKRIWNFWFKWTSRKYTNSRFMYDLRYSNTQDT